MKRLATDLPAARGPREGEFDPNRHVVSGVSDLPITRPVTPRSSARSTYERVLTRPTNVGGSSSTRGARLSSRSQSTTTKTYGVNQPYAQPVTPKNVPGMWHKSMDRTPGRMTREDMIHAAENAASEHAARLRADGAASQKAGGDRAHYRALLTDALGRERDAVGRGDAIAVRRAREDVRKYRKLSRFGGK